MGGHVVPPVARPPGVSYRWPLFPTPRCPPPSRTTLLLVVVTGGLVACSALGPRSYDPTVTLDKGQAARAATDTVAVFTDPAEVPEGWVPFAKIGLTLPTKGTGEYGSPSEEVTARFTAKAKEAGADGLLITKNEKDIMTISTSTGGYAYPEVYRGEEGTLYVRPAP